jgi:cell division protein FtsZ
MANEEGKCNCMGDMVRIFKVKQALGADSEALISNIRGNDLCFFRFSGGNVGETPRLIEELCDLKATGVFLVGIFRFPFRFEGQRRLQTAILQYYQMRELCDAVTYIHADGMLETLNEETSVEDAYQKFDWVEDEPIRAIEEMLRVSEQASVNAEDLRTFLSQTKGPVYTRTLDTDASDEPLHDVLDTPCLADDYTEGRQLIAYMGCAKDMPMSTFQLMNLHLHDLFHNCESFKLGTYFLDKPGRTRFRITLMVNGIADPYPQTQPFRRFRVQQLWLKRQWSLMTYKGKNLNHLVLAGPGMRGDNQHKSMLRRYQETEAHFVDGLKPNH